MSRAEIKEWSKEKIKGHIWEILIPIVVASVLTSFSVGYDVIRTSEGFKVNTGINYGIFFYFVQVGIIWFMIQFINDKEYKFTDIFRFVNDYVRIFIVNLLQLIFVALWTLCFIIPGIIKCFAYALVPYILGDSNYKNLSYKEVLKKSEEMMDGHKMDYFVFILSFIGWFILAVFTLGILLIWLIPYYTTAQVKFLNDIKTNYEGPVKEKKKTAKKK